MSTVHHHCSWPATCSSLTKSRIPMSSGGVTAFSLKKQASGMTITCYLGITVGTLEAIRAMAQTRIANSQPSPTVAVKAATFIQAYVDSITIHPDDAKGETTRVRKIVESLLEVGLTIEEYSQCVQKAKEFVSGFFAAQGSPVFSPTVTKADIDRWHEQTLLAAVDYGYSSLKLERDPHPIAFSEKDFADFGLSPIPFDPTTISCLSFALLQTRDIQAANLIFNKQIADRALHNLHNSLKTLGYRTVDAPDTGDLVVYFDQGQPTHVGYFYEDGRVLSKLGLKGKYAYRHQLFDVPSAYGNMVVFYRKSPAILMPEEPATGTKDLDTKVEKKSMK